MKDYICLMPFLDESHSFVHGWECGMIWEQMGKGEEFNHRPVHMANKEQISMMAEHFGYEHQFSEIDETWTGFTAKPIDITDIQQ